MLERYCFFDVDKFLGDYTKYERLLRELTEKRSSIADSGGTDYGSVRGTAISDPTEKKVEQLLRLDCKIERLKEYFNLYDTIANSLDKDELKILAYLTTPPSSRSIQRLANSLGYSRTSTYRKIVETREKIRQIADYEL